MLIQDEVVEKLEAKGQKMEFDKEVVAQLAFSICDTLCGTWPNELLQYAKHARRSVVNISDLKLLFRKNENMLSFISNIVESSSLPARKRHFRKSVDKKSAKVTNSSEKADNENMGSLLSENKSALKLTDFWNQPSAIRGRLLHPTSNYTSEITGEKFSSNLMSLQKEIFVANEKETPFCCKQITNAATRLRKTKGKKERGCQKIRITDEPTPLNSSDSRKKEELEVVRTVVSTSPYSSDKKILQTLQSITNCFSGVNREVCTDGSVSNDLFMEIKMDAPKNNILLLDNEARVGSSTAEVTAQKTPYVGRDKVDKSQAESGIQNPSDEKPVFSAETLLRNSIKRKSERQQFTNRSLKNKSSSADDCFSSFKFESDEDSDESYLPGVNEDSINMANLGSPSTNSLNRPYQNDSLNNQKKQQNIDSEESVIDLDATVFDF